MGRGTHAGGSAVTVECIPSQVIAYMLRELIAHAGEAHICDRLVLERVDLQRLVACSVAPSARVREATCRLFAELLAQEVSDAP